jgi:hypothetical protein
MAAARGAFPCGSAGTCAKVVSQVPPLSPNAPPAQPARSGTQLKPAGPPQLARYDPPWQLPFMRRNEIVVPVAR